MKNLQHMNYSTKISWLTISIQLQSSEVKQERNKRNEPSLLCLDGIFSFLDKSVLLDMVFSYFVKHENQRVVSTNHNYESYHSKMSKN